MSEQMFQHLSQESVSCLKNVLRLKREVFIKWKAGGKVGGPPNFEQPTLVQKKNPTRKNCYDLRLVSKVGGSWLKLIYLKNDYDNSLHNKPIDVEDDIDAYVDMSFVPLRYQPMRNLHEIQMSYGENPQETRLINIDVSFIMSNMLDKYQMNKEVDNLSHEDIFGDNVITDFDSHDHAFKVVKTLGQSVICKNESSILVCTLRIMKALFQCDISPQNYEDQSRIRDSEKQVVTVINGNNTWNATYDINIRDCEELMMGSRKLHGVQQRMIKYEFNMTEDMSYLLDSQEEKMKNSSSDPL